MSRRQMTRKETKVIIAALQEAKNDGILKAKYNVSVQELENMIEDIEFGKWELDNGR